MVLERFDLVTKISRQDIAAFADEFEVMKIEDLPKPEIECREKFCDLLNISYKSSL